MLPISTMILRPFSITSVFVVSAQLIQLFFTTKDIILNLAKSVTTALLFMIVHINSYFTTQQYPSSLTFSLICQLKNTTLLRMSA
jgi:hypothetical protein